VRYRIGEGLAVVYGQPNPFCNPALEKVRERSRALPNMTK